MENAIDPLAGLDAEIPEDTARAHAAVLAKGGISLDDVNRSLTSRNMAPLAANARDLAEAQRDALLNSDSFQARYSAADPAAVAELFKADLRVQQANGKLTDKPPAPQDYNLQLAGHLAGARDEAIEAYSTDMARLAAKLQLPQSNAQTLVDAHFAALKQTAGMTDDERSMYGQHETESLHSVLGADAEAKLKVASDKLNQVGGGKLDISAICRSNGATVAILLYQQAETLIARK